MISLRKLKPGDAVAILSPSFGAAGTWPHVHELGLSRLQNIFGLDPVEFPSTRALHATTEERARDLVAAFEDPKITGIISTIGGNDQVTYIKRLPSEPFADNPKPFFGFSDNTHFMNFLWLNGIPSYYGGALFTQLAMQGEMDEYTVKYLKHAFFDDGEFEIMPSPIYNDIGVNWDDPRTLHQKRKYETNDGWFWDGAVSATGITWGGCLESIDEILRHGVSLPSNAQFKNVVLITETSEEVPSSDYVFRVYRALGERGILASIRGVVVGRAKAWEFDKPADVEQKKVYRSDQRDAILKVVRAYNPTIPVIQNLDFGHTDPQLAIPFGSSIKIDSQSKKIFVKF